MTTKEAIKEIVDDLSESEVETLMAFLSELTDGEHRRGEVFNAGADLRSLQESRLIDPLAGLIGIFGQGDPANIADVSPA